MEMWFLLRPMISAAPSARHRTPNARERQRQTDRRKRNLGSNEIEIMLPAAAVDTRAPESANIMANIVALSRDLSR